MNKEKILVGVSTDNLVKDVEFKVSETSYDTIIQNITETWPDWKKELCNKGFVVSANSKKL
ncbi:MAG: hypothetical protein IJG16_04750 [Clostridia bacterium]|nr:hypothetical protein [Clostridia bacterium]